MRPWTQTDDDWVQREMNKSYQRAIQKARHKKTITEAAQRGKDILKKLETAEQHAKKKTMEAEEEFYDAMETLPAEWSWDVWNNETGRTEKSSHAYRKGMDVLNRTPTGRIHPKILEKRRLKQDANVIRWNAISAMKNAKSKPQVFTWERNKPKPSKPKIIVETVEDHSRSPKRRKIDESDVIDMFGLYPKQQKKTLPKSNKPPKRVPREWARPSPLYGNENESSGPPPGSFPDFSTKKQPSTIERILDDPRRSNRPVRQNNNVLRPTPNPKNSLPPPSLHHNQEQKSPYLALGAIAAAAAAAAAATGTYRKYRKYRQRKRRSDQL